MVTFWLAVVTVAYFGRLATYAAALGESCAVSGCNDVNSECVAGTQLCACIAGYIEVAGSCQLECVTIFAPLHGTMTVNGAVHSFLCDVGFQMVGAGNIACQSGGVWTSTVPSCNANTQYDGICEQDAVCVTTNSVCRNDGTGTTKCLCAVTGQYHNTALDVCLADCGSPQRITNGAVQTVSGTVEGETATYSCNPGYAMSGSPDRLCQADAHWSGTAPSCVQGCPELVPPAFGLVNTTSGLAVGHQATYSCESGYQLVGALSRTCMTDSSWSGVVPACAKVCGPLPNLSKGTVDLSAGVYEGQSAIYRCNTHYALVGSPVRKCGSTGQWDGSEPSCIFAIVPDTLIAIVVLFVFLVLVDIFVLGIFLYSKFCSRSDNNDKKSDLETISSPQMQGKQLPEDTPDEKVQEPPVKMENTNLPTERRSSPSISSSQSIKMALKGKLSKVGPAKTPSEVESFKRPEILKKNDDRKNSQRESTSISLPHLNRNTESISVPTRKPPVPKQPRRPVKTPSPELPIPVFKNETVPFVPLVTSVPPVTTCSSYTDDRKQELLHSGGVTPVEVPLAFLTEVESWQQGNSPEEVKQHDSSQDVSLLDDGQNVRKEDRRLEDKEDDDRHYDNQPWDNIVPRGQSPDIETVSLGHLTNPVFDFDSDDESAYTEFSLSSPTTMPDVSTTFKGRLSMPAVTNQEEAGEKPQQSVLQDGSRRRMRATVNAYLPTL